MRRRRPQCTAVGAGLALTLIACGGGNTVRWDIWDAASENVTEMRLIVESEHSNTFPSASEDGKIVFESLRNGNTDIWLYDLNAGAGVQQLTTDPGPDRFPSVHPDGKRFTFISNRAGESRPYYFMGEVGLPTAVTLVPVSDPTVGTWTAGHISPDGTTFAYSSGSYIWLLNLDNNRRTQLMTGYDPAWTPDGERIVFRRKARDFGRYVSTSIWSARRNGTRVTEVVAGTDNVTVEHARVSPDGRKLCYDRRAVDDGPAGDFSTSDIWVSRIDGTRQTQLTTAPGNDQECSWYGNDHIVFASDRPTSGRLPETGWNIWMLTLPRNFR